MARIFVLLLVCLLSAFAVIVDGSGQSLGIVMADGSFRQATQLSTFLGSKAPQSIANACPLISVLDLCADSTSFNLINTLFKTNFPSSSQPGVSLDLTEDSAVLLACYDTMFSSKFCGSKAADFCGAVSDSVVVVLPANDLAEYLSGHDQALRRVLKIASDRQATDSRPASMLILVDTTSAPSDDDSTAKAINDIIATVNTLWSEVAETEAAKRRKIEVQAFPVNANDKQAVEMIRGEILTMISSLRESNLPTSTILGSKLSEAWGVVAAETPRPLLSPAEKQSVYFVETAFSAGIAQCESAFSHWHARVGAGKTVGKFGSRVQQLLEGVQKRFLEQTTGTIAVRERASRLRQLISNVQNVAANLFRQQLLILQSQATSTFRQTLIRMARESTSTDPTSIISKEDLQQELRKAVFDFRTLALELEVEALGLSSTTAQNELATSLQTLADEFPESSFGKLEAVRKLERQVKRPKKKRGVGKGRAINIGLNLVGMLRPPGYGNLQGFIGYSTALMGLPLELLLGVQNDGDSPEVMGEDREYPILRLQPKVHFDIDV